MLSTTTARNKPASPATTATAATSAGAGPLYEIRLVVPARGRWFLEVWQLPSPYTPRLSAPERVAGLGGRALDVLEHRVLKRLARARIDLGVFTPGKRKSWPLDEDAALRVGLLFRVAAPMRNLDRIRQVCDAIEAMTREESAYWLGMAMHRKNPRRVLAALRILAEAS